MNRTRWRWLAVIALLLAQPPPRALADPAPAVSIWGTMQGGGIQVSPADESSLPPFDDLIPEDGSLRANWVESPGAAVGESLVDGLTVTKVPEAWVPTVVETAPGAFNEGLSVSADFQNGPTAVNAESCKVKGEGLAPTAPPFAGAPNAPRSQGPERAPGGADAATTDGAAVASDPVNPFNGELVISETDLEFPGFGVPFRHTRTYRSRVDFALSAMGVGWTHSLDRRLVASTSGACAGVTYTAGDGTTMEFVEAATIDGPIENGTVEFETVYRSPRGVRVTLRAEGKRFLHGSGHIITVATWMLTTPDGTIAVFDARGVMVRIEDLNQRGLSLTWSENSTGEGYRLDQVVDSVGRVIEYAYYPDDRLKSVRHAASGLQATYGYTPELGDLETATSSDGRTQHYVYDSGHSVEMGDYIPEAQLRSSCERLCGAQGSSCEATGICDGVAAEWNAQCKTSCVTCVEEGSHACLDYCTNGAGESACLGAPSPTEPDCVTGCATACAANADAACDAFYEGKPLEPGGPSPSTSVESLCADCTDTCREHCGYNCFNIGACLVGAGLLAGTIPEPVTAGGVALAGAIICLDEGGGFKEGLKDLWAFAKLGFFAVVESLECVADTVCEFFGGSCGDCEYESTAHAFVNACNDTCQSCCAYGESCTDTSCQDGRSCALDCKNAFLGNAAPDSPEDAAPACLNTNVNGGGGCPERFVGECQTQCTRQCSLDCRAGCEVECNEAVAHACGYANSQCPSNCDAMDFVDLCRQGCKDGCVDEGQHGSAPRYGYERDLNHNLTMVLDGDLTPYLTNVYGTDPTKPSFDAVITQVTGGRTLTFAYRDLEGEVRGDVEEPPAGSALATYATTQGRFAPVDICPTPCDAPIVFPTGEWVPTPFGLLLVDKAAALGGLGSIGSVNRSAALPPTLLSITAKGGVYRATSVTGAAGLPTGLAFKLILPNGGAITFAPRTGGASWDLSGKADVLASFATANAEVTLVRDTGAAVRLYPGRPRSLAHLVSGTCLGPFRAERNDAGQLQTSPASVCKGDLTISPMATAVTDPEIVGKYASGSAALLAAVDAFGGSPLVPGRYVTRWVRVPGSPGRYESAVGPEEGGAPSTLTTMAFATVQGVPLLRAPLPPSTLADGRPLFAFHVPQGLRPTSTTTTGPTFVPAWDLGSRFDVPTRDVCQKTGMPGPPTRGPTSEGPVPSSASVVTDPYGVVWTFYYDARGNTLRQINHGTGAVRSYNYDAVGDLVGIEQPLGDRTCMRYDDAGNLVNAFQFPVPGAIGDTFPIRQRWTYRRYPTRPERVFDPRDTTKALATYEWDDRGRLLSITDATNTVTSFVPTDFGLPGEIHGPDGSIEKVDYDESVGLPRVITTDAAGPSPVVRVVEYDAAGRMTEAVDSLGEQLVWTWEGGKLTGTSKTADGVSTSTLYTVNDGQVRVSGHGMRMTDITYDLLGLPKLMRVRALDGSADTRISCTKYGPGGRLLEEIRPDGSRMKYDYDGEGRLRTVVGGAWPRTANDGFEPECVVATPSPGEYASGTLAITSYDPNGRPVAVIDAAGEQTKLAYDGFGRVAMVTDPRGASHRAGYDAMGQAVWTASYAPSAATTAYHAPIYGESGLVAAATSTYDALGRIQRQEAWQFDPNGAPIGTGKAITTYAYQPALGQLLVTDPTGAQTLQTFDGAGRLVLTQFPTTDVEVVTYLDGGRTILREWSAPTSDGMLTERVKLTAWGAPLQVENNETGTLKVTGVWTYDADRRPIGVTGTSGQTQGVGYDAFDQAVAVETTVEGQSTELKTVEYDAMGRVVERTSDANNGRGAVASTFKYDVLGRVRAATHPGGRSESFAYKLASSLVAQRTDPRGVAFGYAYTAYQLDAVMAVPPNDTTGSKKQQVAFTRDALGRPTLAKHTGASFTTAVDDVITTLTYDSLGNKLTEWDSGLGSALAITHSPDARGQATHSVLGTLVVDRTFDSLGRLTDVRLAGEAASAVRFTYDGLGGPAQRILASGVTTTYGYDALGRLESQTDTRGAVDLAAWRWEQGIDGVPRLAGLRKHGGAEIASVYQVDSAARVTAERAGVTGLAPNLLSPGDSFAASNLAVAGAAGAPSAVKYTYDGRANWMQRASTAAPALNASPTVDAKDAYTAFGGLTATYDTNGALLTLGDETYAYDALGNLTSASKGSAQKRLYEYDAFGRRIVERDGVTSAITRYGYDGVSRVLRKVPSGAVDVTVDGGLDEHLVRVVGTTRQFYHQDRIRNVYLVTDGQGQPLEWYDYTAFGDMQIRAPNGTLRAVSTIGNRYGYQGQPFDLQFGLVDMRARAYRPAWGRFISPDPIGFAGGPNLYAFVGGAALSFWDPFGLSQMAFARARTDLMNAFDQMLVNSMFARDQRATLDPNNILVDGLRNAPGNAWAGIKGGGRGLVGGAIGLVHAAANMDEVIGAMLRADAAILGWISDPTAPDFDAVGAAIESYALHNDGPEIAGDVGSLFGGAEFALASGGVAVAGFARGSALLKGLVQRGAVATGTAASAEATTVAAEAVAARKAALTTIPDAELACVTGGCAGGGTVPNLAGAAAAEEVAAGSNLLRAGKLADHHLFPQQFRRWFAERGIDIDDFTITVGHETTHLRGIHGRGLGAMPGRWNPRWTEFIAANPQASALDVYQFVGRMMDEFGLSHIPIHPYGVRP